MTITELKVRDDVTINTLVELWERSVCATHHFLTEFQILEIKTFVPNALKQVPHLLISRDETTLLGFIGIDGQKIEMLFIDPKYRRQGIGTALVKEGLAHYSVNKVDVNEDNPQARGFYEHLGFKVIRRSPIDGQGNPFPILSMQIQ